MHAHVTQVLEKGHAAFVHFPFHLSFPPKKGYQAKASAREFNASFLHRWTYRSSATVTNAPVFNSIQEFKIQTIGALLQFTLVISLEGKRPKNERGQYPAFINFDIDTCNLHVSNNAELESDLCGFGIASTWRGPSTELKAKALTYPTTPSLRFYRIFACILHCTS